jgi:hypothetical protein
MRFRVQLLVSVERQSFVIFFLKANKSLIFLTDSKPTTYLCLNGRKSDIPWLRIQLITLS